MGMRYAGHVVVCYACRNSIDEVMDEDLTGG